MIYGITCGFDIGSAADAALVSPGKEERAGKAWGGKEPCARACMEPDTNFFQCENKQGFVM